MTQEFRPNAGVMVKHPITGVFVGKSCVVTPGDLQFFARRARDGDGELVTVPPAKGSK